MKEDLYKATVRYGKILLKSECKWETEEERMNHNFPTREQELSAKKEFLDLLKKEIEQ